MAARSLLICIVLVIYPHYAGANQSEPVHASDKEEERWMHADECFSKAVEKVEMRCKDMTAGVVLGVRSIYGVVNREMHGVGLKVRKCTK